jgi:hypothetical protein
MRNWLWLISAVQQLPVTLVPPSFLKAKFHLSWINVMLSLIE